MSAYPEIAAPPASQALSGYTAVAPTAPEEPARVEVRASQPVAGQAHPRRVAVRVVKAAGAELGLFFNERGGHLEVTRYTGALADAIADARIFIDAGDRIYEVNNVRGDPAVLRDALAATRSASSLVLVFERPDVGRTIVNGVIQPARAAAPPAPLYTPQNTSERGGAVLAQARRGPICVKPRPTGCMGGFVGAAVGASMFGPAGLFLGAFIGNRWLHGKRKNESLVYIKPEPGAREAVRVKLWKLGETAPLTDTGLQLVLEARNSVQMERFLERLCTLFHGRQLTSGQDRRRINAYAKHMVASKSLHCTVTEVMSELSS